MSFHLPPPPIVRPAGEQQAERLPVMPGEVRPVRLPAGLAEQLERASDKALLSLYRDWLRAYQRREELWRMEEQLFRQRIRELERQLEQREAK